MRTALRARRERPIPPAKPKGGYQLIPAAAWPWPGGPTARSSSDWSISASGSPPARWTPRRCRVDPPAPPVRPRRAPAGSPGCPPGGSRSPSAGSRRHGCWAGRNPPSHSRPRPTNRAPRPRRLRAVPRPDSQPGPPGPGPPPHPPAPGRRRRPALIATILGHLIRCLYLKGRQMPRPRDGSRRRGSPTPSASACDGSSRRGRN